MKKVLILAIVAVLSLGLLTACGGGGGGATVKLDVVAGENGAMTFNPATLTVKKGDTVQVNLINKDAAQAHSFVINEFNLKMEQVPASQTKSQTFKADKTGDFTYYCDVPGHKDAGMTGKITVTP